MERPSRSPVSQIRVVIVCPGSAIAANRTASRFSLVGSSAQACSIAATEVKAIVQRPWMMIPGRPTDFANCSSRWICIGSPDASA